MLSSSGTGVIPPLLRLRTESHPAALRLQRLAEAFGLVRCADNGAAAIAAAAAGESSGSESSGSKSGAGGSGDGESGAGGSDDEEKGSVTGDDAALDARAGGG